MEKYDYPTTVMFRNLTPMARAERLEVAEGLLELFRYLRGDPRLSAWQESFLVGMTHTLTISQGKCRISLKQWRHIREIRDLSLEEVE